MFAYFYVQLYSLAYKNNNTNKYIPNFKIHSFFLPFKESNYIYIVQDVQVKHSENNYAAANPPKTQR